MPILIVAFAVTAFAESGPKSHEDNDVDGVTSATPSGVAGGWSYSLSAREVYQAETDIDRGGSFRLTQYAVGARAGRDITDALELDVDLSYRIRDYGFSGVTSSFGPAPWDEITEVELGLRLRYKLSQIWSLFGGPSVEFARESGGNWGKALRYGAIAAVSGYPRKNLRLGLGLGMFSGLEDVDVFPVLIFSWKLSETLELGNPWHSGPGGPAGLELTYAPDERWTYAAGAAYRSYRFRLNESGIVSEGIGEDSGIPLWVKMSGKLGRWATVSAYAGTLVNGELTLEDNGGRGIASSDYESAPFFALTLSERF